MLGLLSDGGVHSQVKHLFVLLEEAQVAKALTDTSCDQLLADKGYDCDAYRTYLSTLAIEPVIPGKK